MTHGRAEILISGNGPDLGYLHGPIAAPGGDPGPVALATAGFRVSAPRLPGFGSTPVGDPIRNVHEWVFALSEIVDQAGLAGRPLVASSVGAMLALELSAIRPEAFSQLVLLSPLGLWDAADPVADPFATTLSAQRALLTVDPNRTTSFFEDRPGIASAEAVEIKIGRAHV